MTDRWSALPLLARSIVVAITLLFGVNSPAQAGPPVADLADAVQAADPKPAPVVQIHFIVYRAHDTSSAAVTLAGHATSTHSAWAMLYAYCGGDPVNRMDPSGLDWVDYRSDGSFVLLSINIKGDVRGAV